MRKRIIKFKFILNLILKIVLKIGLLCSLLLQVHCYEGSSRKRKDPSGPQNRRVDPIPLPFYTIILDAIMLSPESINDSNCFMGLESEKKYRLNEWSMRFKLIKEGLTQLADKVIINEIKIPPGDCKTLYLIEDRSISNSALNPQYPTQADSKLRLSLHLKAIFWDRDVYSRSPSPSVQSNDWLEIKVLKEKNVRSKSLHYFLISNKTWGYFEYWKWFLPQTNLLFVKGIESPDPGENGLIARDEQIKKETKDFFDWLIGFANE